jgi:hypothetical protein
MEGGTVNGNAYLRAAGMADLTWLLDAGWLARLGQARAPDSSPAGYYLEVRRTGSIVSVNFTGASVAEAALKAHEWAKGQEKASEMTRSAP